MESFRFEKICNMTRNGKILPRFHMPVGWVHQHICCYKVHKTFYHSSGLPRNLTFNGSIYYFADTVFLLGVAVLHSIMHGELLLQYPSARSFRVLCKSLRFWSNSQAEALDHYYTASILRQTLPKAPFSMQRSGSVNEIENIPYTSTTSSDDISAKYLLMNRAPWWTLH